MLFQIVFIDIESLLSIFKSIFNFLNVEIREKSVGCPQVEGCFYKGFSSPEYVAEKTHIIMC